MRYLLLNITSFFLSLQALAQLPKLVVPIGHTFPISCADYSPDGKYIVTGCGDGIAKLWRVADEKLLCDMEGHETSIELVSFSPDGKKIVTASEDNTFRIWDANTGKTI